MEAAQPCPPGDVLLMFLDGALSSEAQASITAHLEGCPTCREVLTHSRDFGTLLRDTGEEHASPEEPCPSAWTLVQYHTGELEEETARHVRAHLFMCAKCFAEVLALEQAQQDSILLTEALSQHLERAQRTTTREVLAASGTLPTTLSVHIQVPSEASISLPLEILYGPSLSTEGHFSLDLSVPDAPHLEGKTVLVQLRLDPYVFAMQGRVERATVSIDHTFASGAPPTASSHEIRAALLQALEISIV